jgi:hypothetical protein
MRLVFTVRKDEIDAIELIMTGRGVCIACMAWLEDTTTID